MAEHNTLLNQSAGHTADIDQWAESEAGKAFIKEANERDKAEKEAAKAQEEVDVEEFSTAAFHENDSDASQSDDDDGPPSKSASKSDWVDYAVSQGADADEADAGTKDDLINQYGG